MSQSASRTPPQNPPSRRRRLRPGSAGGRARSTVATLTDRWRLSPAVQRELAAYRHGQSLPYWHHEQR